MMIVKYYTILVIRRCKIINNNYHRLTIISNKGAIIKI